MPTSASASPDSQWRRKDFIKPQSNFSVPDLIWNEDRVRKAMPKDALTPQARHHFTRFDQVDQLAARDHLNPDLGSMGCLPRRGSGDRGDPECVDGRLA